jgi:hypothetical protein
MTDDAISLHLSKAQPSITSTTLYWLPIQHLSKQEKPGKGHTA